MERSAIPAGRRIVEAGLVFSLFLLYVHCLTGDFPSAGRYGLALTIAVLALLLGVAARGAARRLLLSGGLLLVAFWTFAFFRYLGFVLWPYGDPAQIGGYLLLLYSHFVLALLMLAGVLWGGAFSKASWKDLYLRWGDWRRTGASIKGQMALLAAVAAACWMNAAVVVLRDMPATAGPWIAILGIAVAKAFLTGITEEACYRGVILPLAAERYGAVAGLLLQAALYAVFHAYLGSFLGSRALFLVLLFGLGILFGVVTRITNGIGWAVVVHSALDMLVEWGNITQ